MHAHLHSSRSLLVCTCGGKWLVRGYIPTGFVIMKCMLQWSLSARLNATKPFKRPVSYHSTIRINNHSDKQKLIQDGI